MFKKRIAILLVSIPISFNSFAADFSGYITAKIDSLKCVMNQDNAPELILRTKVTKFFGLMQNHEVFTNKLASSSFCYDLSSFNKFFTENNNEVQIWLQTYQSEVFRLSQIDRSCEKYLDERVYIAVFNGDYRAKLTKSIPVYSTNSIFIKKVPDEMCNEAPENDL